MLEVSWGVPQRAYMFEGNRGVPLQNRKQAHGGPPSRAAPPPASAPPPTPNHPPLRWSRPWVASTPPSQAALRPSWPPLWWHCCWLLAVAVIAAPRMVLTAVETVLAIIKKCVLRRAEGGRGGTLGERRPEEGRRNEVKHYNINLTIKRGLQAPVRTDDDDGMW